MGKYDPLKAEKIKKTLRRVELDVSSELTTLQPIITYKDDMYYTKLRNRLYKVLSRTYDLIREMENEIERLKSEVKK